MLCTYNIKSSYYELLIILTIIMFGLINFAQFIANIAQCPTSTGIVFFIPHVEVNPMVF